METARNILWKVLVVGMIPFILGAGLPQMECRCAVAKGQRWCECCFRKPDDSLPNKSPLKGCCQRRVALKHESPTVAAHQSVSGCPTCHQFANPKIGSCCSLKQNDAPTLSKLVDPPALDVTLWMPVASTDSLAVVPPLNSRHELLSRASLIPPVDRVIVFEHLLI